MEGTYHLRGMGKSGFEESDGQWLFVCGENVAGG